MQNYQREFIEFALHHQVLRFGEFTLKSGRVSPYFFNTGLFQDGGSLAKLGKFYAEALEHSKITYDGLFGPAYKGIPLVSTVAIALAEQFKKSVPYSFNRKEAKAHGEGGTIVAAPLKGRMIIIDDVVSAGLTMRESIEIIKTAGAIPAGIVVSLDRQERGVESSLSAIQEIEKTFKIPVVSIIKMEDILTYLQQKNEMKLCRQIEQYKKQYGST